jgi:uncharacterized membrane protein YgcG
MPKRLKQTLAIALGCAAALAAVPVVAHAATGMEIAVQDDAVLTSLSYYNRDKALDQAVQIHATRIRVNVTWTSVLGRQWRSRKAPRNPNYDFGAYDGIVDAATAKGLEVQFALTGPAPAFASGNHKVGPFAPKAKFYAGFARAVAEHFKGKVDRYSIWNEPNYAGWLAPQNRAPKLYRALYTAGYSAIKGADPNAQVLIGETSPYGLKAATPPLQFLRGVTCTNKSWRPVGHCSPLKADGYAHHPYDFAHPPTFHYPGADNVTLSGLGKLTGALDKLAARHVLATPGGKALDVYLTEDGYFANGKYKVPPSTQAKRLTQAFQIAQGNSRVREMTQYLLVQPRGKFAFFDTSILDKRGHPRRAFKALAKWAASAARSGKIAVHPTSSSGSSGGPGSSGGSSGGGGGSGGSGGGGGGTPPPNCSPLPVCPPST